MSVTLFDPTPEQCKIINHDGSAFITACPGAGKTRVMVERALSLVKNLPHGRGIAFLSFTRSAIAELEARLREKSILPYPTFPSFIGTFDSFVWQFLVAPFGLPDSNVCPRLLPDIHDLNVKPFEKAHVLPLSCFDPNTGDIDPAAAKRKGFDTSEKPSHQIRAYSSTAKKIRSRLAEQGIVGFDEARAIALKRIGDHVLAPRVSSALAARFVEVIVDEAQDCNPNDLGIIAWLRSSGLPVKIICDPHQSIYGFRGGVTDELFSFSNQMDECERMGLSGNFRSSPNICKAISMLRQPSTRGPVDLPLGEFKHISYPVYVLAYSGNAVPASIGASFCELVKSVNEEITQARVLASTKSSGAAAIGRPHGSKNDRIVRLVRAVMDFHFPSGIEDIKSAVEDTHKIILEIGGHLSDSSYHQYLTDHGVEIGAIRPMVVKILKELRFDPAVDADPKAWHGRAKDILSTKTTIEKGKSISQKLKWNSDVVKVLSAVPLGSVKAQTIHSVKGKEFPAVCVVTTTKTAKDILDFLESGTPQESAEDARKIYVAASRAQKLLVFASPKSQAERFADLLKTQYAEVALMQI